jgi:hypothetical protein
LTVFNLILYLFHEDYIQPEVTSRSPIDCIVVGGTTYLNLLLPFDCTIKCIMQISI